MGTGRKDPKDDDKLLTSEDLFGDMLDEKPSAAPKAPAPTPPPARRSGPIKVQVSEPAEAARAEAAKPVPTKTPSGRITLPKGPLPKFGGQFKDGFHALFRDASVRFIRRYDEAALRGLIIRDNLNAPEWDKIK